MGMDGDVIITMRMLMVGKEIGGIIGKGGANVEKFRQESGARINISSSHAGCNERIVTITGGRTQIHDACSLITEKINEDVNSALSSKATSKIPVTIQLIIPASQCGSIIGKGGVKIKEIRDLTGCSIQVHSEMLPNSSERTVTLSGAPSTIIQCIDMLIDVMIQYPAKTATVPYNPQGNNAPILFHQGQTYMLQGNYPLPNSNDMTKMHVPGGFQKFSGGRDRGQRGFMFDDDDDSSPESSPKSSSFNEPRTSNNFPVRLLNANTQEVIVGNDIMGCIMGKGGSRINEIRALSGAQIRVDHEPKEEGDKESEKPQERKITITGTAEEISLAQYLINLSVQRGADKVGGFSRRNDPVSLPEMFGNPSSLLGQPPMLGGGFFGGGMAPGAYGAALMSAKRSFLGSSYRHRGGNYRGHRSKSSADVDFTADVDIGGDSPNGKDKRKSKREKFQPY